MEPHVPIDGELYPAEATGQRVLRLITPIEAVLSVLAGSDLKHNSHAMYALALAIRLQRLPLLERRALGEGALALIRVSAFGSLSEDDDDDDGDDDELSPDDEAPYG